MRSIFVATDHGNAVIGQWLDACPIPLPEKMKAVILAVVDSASAGGDESGG